MNPELEPTEVGSRLRSEFAVLTEPPPPPTAGIIGLGRRRRRRQLLATAVAVLAVIAGTAVVVPMALRADTPPEPAAPERELTWTYSGLERQMTTPTVPGDRRLWFGWLTSTELRATVMAALRAVSPGIHIQTMSVTREGSPGEFRFLESGAHVQATVVRADGRGGGVEIDIHGRLGDPSEHARLLATTGVRKLGLGPTSIGQNTPRERRSLGGGTEAVVYPKGVGYWMLPVDVFAPNNMSIVVSTSAYPIQALTPEKSVLSNEQSLAVAKRIAELRGAVPKGPGKVVPGCQNAPPGGLPAITQERLDTAVLGALSRLLPGTKMNKTVGEGCWDSLSAQLVFGTSPWGGQLQAECAFTVDGGNSMLRVGVTFRPGSPTERADRLMRTGQREGISRFVAADQINPAYLRERRSLAGGVQAVVYPKRAGEDEAPVDLFAANGFNVTVTASPNQQWKNGKFVTPAPAALTIDQLLAIGQAVAALK